MTQQSLLQHETERNRAVMADFVDLFLRQKRIREAFEKHAAPDYRQHSPDFRDGREGTIQDLEALFASMPEVQIDIRCVLVDGDQAVVHLAGRKSPDDPGIVAVDMFRLEGGKIVEHWDSMQPVPPVSRCGRPMI